MNVLVIIGSPRKKNTLSMCRLIEEKVNAAETVEFEYVFLGEMNLELCRGCMLCISKGEEHCVRIETAALIILSKSHPVIMQPPLVTEAYPAHFFGRKKD